MGTDVVAIADDVAGVRDWFAAAEGIFSRFLKDSELSRLNSSAEDTVAVSSSLASCLAVAQELREKTGGLVDPAVGSAVIGWGYDRTFKEIADRKQVEMMDGVGRWSVDGKVVTRRPGVVLDLGGIAKGWTCDKAVTSGLADVVSAGGDMRSAHQDTVAEITDPWAEIAARVVLGEGGLATSSTTRRQWSVGDAEANHIIDPRRLAPVRSPIFSATVTARTAVEAEAGAKAVLLRGEDGLAWAEQQDWITAALAVWHDGNVYATTGWEIAA